MAEEYVRKHASKWVTELHKIPRNFMENDATFFSPNLKEMVTSKNKPEKGEFAVDFGVSMHMLSKEELTSEESDTVRAPPHPTTVITANGSIDTNEEARVYDRDLDSFVTVQFLEDTPPVMSLGKHS